MKYIIRDGFVVTTKVTTTDGKTFEKSNVGGEEIELKDEVAAQHLHKLELADPKDRAAALKAEQAQKVASFAATDPALLIQQMVTALASAQKAPKE